MPEHRAPIVEDEQDIAGLIKHTLERGGDADAEASPAATRRSKPSPRGRRSDADTFQSSG